MRCDKILGSLIKLFAKLLLAGADESWRNGSKYSLDFRAHNKFVMCVGQLKCCAQILSRSKSVRLFCGQLMLTQKLQRQVAEQGAMINTRMGTKQLCDVRFSGLCCSNRLQRAVQPRKGVGAREVDHTRDVQIHHLPRGGFEPHQCQVSSAAS